MVTVTSLLFVGSLLVILVVVGRISVRLALLPEDEFRMRQGGRLMRYLSGVNGHMKRWFAPDSFFRFLEVNVRRIKIYVLKFEHVLERVIQWARGGEAHAPKNSYWHHVNRGREGVGERRGSGRFVGPSLDGEDFLGLNLDRRQEVLEWFDVED